MKLRVGRLVVCAVAAAAGLSACGGSSGNGVASKSPDQIIVAASDAITHAKSVHVSGSILDSGVPVTLDLDLLSKQGGRGQVSVGGLNLQLVDIGKTVYIRGGQAFWQHFVGAAAAPRLAGKWLKAPATAQFAGLASLTNMQQLLGTVLLSHGSLTKGSTTTIRGQQVIAVRDKSSGGTLYYVATSGPPYPLEVRRQRSQITFDRFNQPVSLTPPANALPLASAA